MKSEPAFPTKINTEHFSHPSTIYNTGMTLRDYFAAKAMPPMLHANAGKWAGNYDAHAKMAYEFADAMLKAREA